MAPARLPLLLSVTRASSFQRIFFGFLQLTRLFCFQFGDFRFQRLFNHRGREDFFFFARTDNNLTIGNVR